MGDTSDILRLLLRRWPILLVGVALGIASGILASNLLPPSYSSTSYLLVVPVQNAEGGNAINYAQAYSRVATDQAVVEKALIDNGIPVEPSKIRQVVSVSTSPDAPLIEITARDPQPERAARLANVVAQGLSTYSKARADATGYRVEQFTPAVPPTRTSSPNRFLYNAIGISIGLLLAGLLAVTLPARRTRRAWQDVLSVYGYPVLAKLPHFKMLGGVPEEELSDAGVRSATSRLLERLAGGLGGQVSGVLVVTSPHGADGKTTISRLLYGLLSEHGRQVLYASAVRQRFLVTGHAEEFSASEQQFAASDFAKVVDDLRPDCDVLIVDAQPLTRPADLQDLLSLAEAVVVVVGDRDPGYRLRQALPMLDEIAPPFVGVVLNQPGRRLITAKPGRDDPPEEPYGPRVVAS